MPPPFFLKGVERFKKKKEKKGRGRRMPKTRGTRNGKKKNPQKQLFFSEVGFYEDIEKANGTFLAWEGELREL